MSSYTFTPDPNDHELIALMANQKTTETPEPASPENAFIKRFVNARLEKGQAQVALAQMAGIPQSALARIESGKGNPTLKTLTKLADAMGYELTLLRKPR